MRRKDFSEVECSIARAVDEVCDPWTLLVLRHAFLGARRFGEFESQLGIPTNTLTKRLEKMVEDGLLERHLYETHPSRFEYELTVKGLDLLPMLVALAVWGSRWKSPGGAPFELVDPASGSALRPTLVDEHTGRPILPGTIALTLGPGASPTLKKAFRRMKKPYLVMGAAVRAGAPEAEG